MPGFSLTLLLLPRSGDKYSSSQILDLVDSPANAPGWAWSSKTEPGKIGAKVEETHSVSKGKEVDLPLADGQEFLEAIKRACYSLIEAEPELTKQDQIAGDGDAGLTLEAGAKALLKAIKEGKLSGKNAIEDIGAIAEIVEEDMGGTSGALYSIFFAGLGKALRDEAGKGAKSTTPEVWAAAAAEALKILYKCTFISLILAYYTDIQTPEPDPHRERWSTPWRHSLSLCHQRACLPPPTMLRPLPTRRKS